MPKIKEMKKIHNKLQIKISAIIATGEQYTTDQKYTTGQQCILYIENNL